MTTAKTKTKTPDEIKRDVLKRNITHLFPNKPHPIPKGCFDYGYIFALQAAGFAVEHFHEFEDPDNTWWCYGMAPNGEHYIVRGTSGSCRHCDPFTEEYGDDVVKNGGKLRALDLAKLQQFGRKYLEDVIEIEDAMARGLEVYDGGSVTEGMAMIRWVLQFLPHLQGADPDKLDATVQAMLVGRKTTG